MTVHRFSQLVIFNVNSPLAIKSHLIDKFAKPSPNLSSTWTDLGILTNAAALRVYAAAKLKLYSAAAKLQSAEARVSASAVREHDAAARVTKVQTLLVATIFKKR